MSANEILLMRHAKSDWNTPGLEDIDRPLNARGNRSAPIVAKWLCEQSSIPSLILSSPSVRTRQTYSHMIEYWRRENCELPEVIEVESLYLAPPNTLLEIAKDHAIDRAGRLMVLAHNPGLELLISHLASTRVEIPTAAVVAFKAASESWPRDWHDASQWQWLRSFKPRDADA